MNFWRIIAAAGIVATALAAAAGITFWPSLLGSGIALFLDSQEK